MKKIVAVFIAVIMAVSVFAAFPVSAVGEDPDTYFYDTTGTTVVQMGYWLWLDSGNYIADQTDMKIKFTTPNAFSGFTMLCDSGNPTMTIRLLKKSGAVLEEVSQLIIGDWNTVNFSKTYPAGTYTIQIFAAHPHFVLRGTAANAAMPVTVTGGVYNYAGTYPNGAPMIKLIGAVAPDVVEENPDIWFYKDGTVVEGTPDWGLGPGVSSGYGTPAANGYVNVSFFAPSGFSGIGFMYQTYGAANIDAYLLDRDGNGLEYFNINVNSGSLASFDHSFSKTYERGSYILQFADAGTADGCFFWMMKGKANESLDFSTGGNLANNEGIHDGPAIVLYGDEPAVRESGYSFYKQVGPATIGWWMYPDAFANDTEMNITFTAPAPFYGFQMESHASQAMTASIQLYDSTNTQLGATITASMAEGTKAITFPQQYPAGNYTIIITHVSAGGQYFVLRAGEKTTGANITVNGIPAGANNTASALSNPAPAIKLLGPEIDPDVWFCCGLPYTTGWGIGSGINASVANGNINFTFTSESAFRGFKMACYADSASPAVIQTKLLDVNGNTLETLANQTITGDHTNLAQGFTDVIFSKAYNKGTYTVQMTIVGGSYFYLASSREAYDAVCKITGNNITSDSSLGGPGIMLYGASAPRDFGIIDNNKLNIVIDGGTALNEALPGEEVDVKIRLENNTTISSLKMVLSYDEKLSVVTNNGKPVVTYDVFDPTDDSAMIETTLNASENKITLNWMTVDGEIKDASVTYATVRFKVADDAKPGSFLPITAKIDQNDVFDSNWQNVDFYLINGYVDIPTQIEVSKGHDETNHWSVNAQGQQFNVNPHTFGEWITDTAATPVSNGHKHRTCSVCGYTETEDIPMVSSLKFYSVSLTLQNNIQINYKIKKSYFTEVGYTDPYVVFVKEGVETVVDTYTVSDDCYVFSFSNIAPDRLNDNIEATVYATYNNVQYSSSVLNYSIATYCYNQLNRTTSTKLRTLLVDLLHYGTASQIYTDHNTANLADANLTAAQSAWASPDSVLDGLVSVTNSKYATVSNPELTWKAVALNLKESIMMQFGFAIADTSGVTIKIKDENGKVLETINADECPVINGYLRANFIGLGAGQMKTSVFVTAYRGNTAISNTLRYSIESYAKSKINTNNTDTLSNLLKAMMKYGTSASDYIHN